MKTRIPNQVDEQRRGAVAFVVVTVVILLLLTGTALLFMGASRTSMVTVPAPTPAFTLAWRFGEPTVVAEDGRWTVVTQLSIQSADPVRIEDLEAFVVRGARRVRGDVSTGPPTEATKGCPLEFGFDEVPGAVTPTLEVSFTAILADGLSTKHHHRADLAVD